MGSWIDAATACATLAAAGMLLTAGCGGASSTPTEPARAAAAPADPAWRAEIQKWREARETRLKSDTGWLTVAGLFWLKEGENRFGADEALEIPLPQGERGAPALAGSFHYHDGKVTVTLQPGVAATVGGAAVTAGRAMASDNPGPPDELVLNDLTLFVIHRGEKDAIRLRDKNSRYRREFTGLHWFPLDESYRVTARWEPHAAPTSLQVPNIIGITEAMPSPGRAHFTLEGKEYSLDPVLNSPDDQELFFIFKDQTAGHETYGAGRFLYTPLPKEGQLVLDFNKAYTPPCAFTPHATCPLPPEQNRLAARVEAGEKNYGAH